MPIIGSGAFVIGFMVGTKQYDDSMYSILSGL